MILSVSERQAWDFKPAETNQTKISVSSVGIIKEFSFWFGSAIGYFGFLF